MKDMSKAVFVIAVLVFGYFAFIWLIGYAPADEAPIFLVPACLFLMAIWMKLE